jgi:hypothetical protein
VACERWRHSAPSGKVSPGVFANTAVSDLYRDRQGSLRNAFLSWGDEHLLKSAAALGHSMETGASSFGHVFGEAFWNWTRRHPSQNERCSTAPSPLCAATNTADRGGVTRAAHRKLREVRVGELTSGFVAADAPGRRHRKSIG